MRPRPVITNSVPTDGKLVSFTLANVVYTVNNTDKPLLQTSTCDYYLINPKESTAGAASLLPVLKYHPPVIIAVNKKRFSGRPITEEVGIYDSPDDFVIDHMRSNRQKKRGQFEPMHFGPVKSMLQKPGQQLQVEEQEFSYIKVPVEKGGYRIFKINHKSLVGKGSFGQVLDAELIFEANSRNQKIENENLKTKKFVVKVSSPKPNRGESMADAEYEWRRFAINEWRSQRQHMKMEVLIFTTKQTQNGEEQQCFQIQEKIPGAELASINLKDAPAQYKINESVKKTLSANRDKDMAIRASWMLQSADQLVRTHHRTPKGSPYIHADLSSKNIHVGLVDRTKITVTAVDYQENKKGVVKDERTTQKAIKQACIPRAEFLDFGISVAMDERNGAASVYDNHSGGSPGFAAPETTQFNSYRTGKSDVFSMAPNAVFIFGGTDPFNLAEVDRLDFATLKPLSHTGIKESTDPVINNLHTIFLHRMYSNSDVMRPSAKEMQRFYADYHNAELILVARDELNQEISQAGNADAEQTEKLVEYENSLKIRKAKLILNTYGVWSVDRLPLLLEQLLSTINSRHLNSDESNFKAVLLEITNEILALRKEPNYRALRDQLKFIKDLTKTYANEDEFALALIDAKDFLGNERFQRQVIINSNELPRTFEHIDFDEQPKFVAAVNDIYDLFKLSGQPAVDLNKNINNGKIADLANFKACFPQKLLSLLVTDLHKQQSIQAALAALKQANAFTKEGIEILELGISIGLLPTEAAKAVINLHNLELLTANPITPLIDDFEKLGRELHNVQYESEDEINEKIRKYNEDKYKLGLFLRSSIYLDVDPQNADLKTAAQNMLQASAQCHKNFEKYVKLNNAIVSLKQMQQISKERPDQLQDANNPLLLNLVNLKKNAVPADYVDPQKLEIKVEGELPLSLHQLFFIKEAKRAEFLENEKSAPSKAIVVQQLYEYIKNNNPLAAEAQKILDLEILKLERFKYLYRNTYDKAGFFGRNNFSSMNRKLDKLASFKEVEEYAKEKESSRTSEILKTHFGAAAA